MNLNVSGHHVEVTPAIRSYVRTKLEPQILPIHELVGISPNFDCVFRFPRFYLIRAEEATK